MDSTYVHCLLLKTPLGKQDSTMNLLCFEVKTTHAINSPIYTGTR
jgi:hypothetical protein